METPNKDQLSEFTLDNLPDLDVITLGALELFSEKPIDVSLPTFQRPLVIGSVGAFVTGRIMYAGTNAVFADESNFIAVLDSGIDVDGAVLISASGSKHAITMAEELQKRSIQTFLLTNNSAAPAKAFLAAENILVLPRNREPYTNNTSTYLGMILARSGEQTAALIDFINDFVDPALTHDLSAYDSFTFILPKDFSEVCGLIRIKFEEMFEPKVHGRAYSDEEIMHAKTVVRGENELFISLGVENNFHGFPENRLSVPLPEQLGPAGMMAVSYYIVGKIQAEHPPYFKDSLPEYAKRASDIFGKEITPIVE